MSGGWWQENNPDPAEMRQLIQHLKVNWLEPTKNWQSCVGKDSRSTPATCINHRGFD